MRIRSIALIFALALLLAGCTQTKLVGYLEKDHPIGSQMQGKLPLLSKEGCLFGSGVSIVKSQDTSLCSSLDEGADYSIQGKVSSYMSATSGALNIAEAALSESGNNADIRISVPVVALEAPKRLAYEESIFDSILWEQNTSQQIQMACSNKSKESEVEVLVTEDKHGPIPIWLPAANDFGSNATLDKATFGYFDIGESGSATRIWWLMLKIIWQGSPADGSDIVVQADGDRYDCARLHDEGAASYYSCETYKEMGYADFESVNLSAYTQKDTVCNGAVAIQH